MSTLRRKIRPWGPLSYRGRYSPIHPLYSHHLRCSH